MNRKYSIISFGLFVLIIVFGIVMFNSSSDESLSNTEVNLLDSFENVTSNLSDVEVSNIEVSSSTSITLADLEKHNAEKDCWVGFKGKAYDLTDWLPKHPGSAGAILPYCGKAQEFEDAFIKKHGEGKFGLFMRVAILIGDLTFQGNING